MNATKKFSLLCIFLLICAVFTACSGRVTPENLDLDKAFSFTARIEYGGAASAAEFKRTASGVWEGVLTEPYALQGIQMGFAPEGMTVSYSDLAVRYNPNAQPDINVAAFLLFRTMEKAIAAEQVNIKANRELIEVSGMFDGDDYVLRLDSEGIPLSLEIPALRFKAEFTDVTAERLAQSDISDFASSPDAYEYEAEDNIESESIFG